MERRSLLLLLYVVGVWSAVPLAAFSSSSHRLRLVTTNQQRAQSASPIPTHHRSTTTDLSMLSKTSWSALWEGSKAMAATTATSTITTTAATTTTSHPHHHNALLSQVFGVAAPAFGLSGAMGSVALFDATPPLVGMDGTAVAATAAFLGKSASSVSLEAHLLTALSHVGLDLAVWFAPGLLVLRVLAIVGRLCTMAADYMPDHVIFPEELLFQACMLTVAWIGLFQAALLPIVSATVPNVTPREGRTYLALFQPTGMSWTDYKALSACALDWRTMSTGETLVTKTVKTDEDNADVDGEYVYWLYSGEIEVHAPSGIPAATRQVPHTLTRSPGKSFKQDAAGFLIGERLLLATIKPQNKQPKKSIFRKVAGANGRTASPTSVAPINSVGSSTTTIVSVVAKQPSTLLRIHLPSLKLLMDNDAHFAESIRTLVFQGMESKLLRAQAPLPAQHEESPPRQTMQHFLLSNNKTAAVA